MDEKRVHKLDAEVRRLEAKDVAQMTHAEHVRLERDLSAAYEAAADARRRPS